MVQLRQTAITDLTLRYARHMGGNKVRHYVVPAMTAYAQGLVGPEGNYSGGFKELVANYISRKEGVTDIEFVESARPASSDYTLCVEDVTKQVLKGEFWLKRALKKLKAKQFLIEYKTFDSISQKLKEFYNSLVYRSYRGLRLGGVKRFPLPTFDTQYNRALHIVRFLTITCEEDELEQAFEALKQDLKILHKNGLIVGNLAMPSILALADTVGIGKKTYAVFCFPVINELRAQKLLKKTQLEMPLNYLELFGVKYESRESETRYLNGVDIASKYEIEVVEVMDDEAKLISIAERDKAVVDSYNTSREHVLRAAKKQSDFLKDHEKVSNSETHVHTDSSGKRTAMVHVEVTLLKKSTEE